MLSNRKKTFANTTSLCGIFAHLDTLNANASFSFASETYRWTYICRRRA